MLIRLFDNPGHTIKIIGKVNFYFIFILGFILAITMFGATDSFFLNFLFSLLTIIGGGFIALLSSIFLYGFGDLIEKTQHNNRLLKEISNNLKDNNNVDVKGIVNLEKKPEVKQQPIISTPIKESKTINTPKQEVKSPINKPTPTPIKDNSSKVKPNSHIDECVDVVSDSEGYVVCPKCGKKQKADRNCCFICGVKFNHK